MASADLCGVAVCQIKDVKLQKMFNKSDFGKVEMTKILSDQGLYEVRREHDACGIGAVVNISGKADHSIINYGKEILVNLHHRGAAGADETTGDGAGILFQIPHEFFFAQSKELKIELPPQGKYAVAQLFAPKNKELREKQMSILEQAIELHGLKIIAER